MALGIGPHSSFMKECSLLADSSSRVDEIVVVARAVNVVGSTRQLTSIAYAPQRMFNSHRRRD